MLDLSTMHGIKPQIIMKGTKITLSTLVTFMWDSALETKA